LTSTADRLKYPSMPEAKPSHTQHESADDPAPRPPLWQTLRDAHAERRRQWRAHSDLLAEQLAGHGGATVKAGLHLWAESMRAGWALGRQWQSLTVDAWRRSLDLLR
jgi:hypothetical protein